MTDDTELRALRRQVFIATTFVDAVDTLVGDFDVIDVLTVLSSRCGELLGVAAAGILLADDDGCLRLIAASTEHADLLELFQIQNDEGPCLDCLKTGHAVFNAHLGDRSPWPQFAAESIGAGYPSVSAVPLRLKGTVLGCLNMFMSEPVPLSDADAALAQALADVASVTIVQDELTRGAANVEGGLQHALDSRIAIEQAKGMIAERGNVDMIDAFALLRNFARTNLRRLTEVADALVDGTLTVGDVNRSSERPAPPATEP